MYIVTLIGYQFNFVMGNIGFWTLFVLKSLMHTTLWYLNVREIMKGSSINHIFYQILWWKITVCPKIIKLMKFNEQMWCWKVLELLDITHLANVDLHRKLSELVVSVFIMITDNSLNSMQLQLAGHMKFQIQILLTRKKFLW